MYEKSAEIAIKNFITYPKQLLKLIGSFAYYDV